MCESTCNTLPSSATNQSKNTFSVAQGYTATPGATQQLLSLDMVLKNYMFIYVYIYARSINSRLIGRSSSFLVCSL